MRKFGVTRQQWVSCTRKVAWFDPIAAATHRAMLPGGETTNLYLCQFCGSIHIGRKPERLPGDPPNWSARAADRLLRRALGLLKKDPVFRGNLQPNRWVLDAVEAHRLCHADAEREPADA